MELLSKIKIFILSLFVGVCLFSCQKSNNVHFKINSEWKFKLLDKDDNNEAQFENVDFNDSNWETVNLPHTAHLEPLIVNNQWQGICWYRKSFDLPLVDDDKKVFVEFEAAMSHSVIWINGVEVAMHKGGYLPVVIDATKYIVKGQTNTIAVRLNNTDNPLTGPKPLAKLDFNMYGGLYRNAWLSVKDKLYISHPAIANKVAGGGVFITYPKVSKDLSEIAIKTNVVNEFTSDKTIKVTQKILFDNKEVQSKTTSDISIQSGKDIDVSMNITLPNAKLWSPKQPNLYSLETSIIVDGNIIDQETTRFGIRKFEFKNKELFINGEKTFLRGVNRHQEYPFVGYALSDNAQYRDAKKIKDAGFNYIRLSHYPQSPSFLDACDELGLVVLDAILGWQYYLDNDQFRAYCYKSAEQLIRRDRNHPSVLAWEVSLNETQMPVFFMEELDRIVHAEYPGENVYSSGWMDDVYDIYLQARQHRILSPHKLKDKPYSVSEYGDWEYYSKNAGLNQDQLPNDLRDEFSSRQKRAFGEERLLRQAANVQEAHNDNLQNTVAFSDSYWVMYDYNRGYHNDIEASGLMDIFRLPKFAYYFYQSQRDIEDGAVVKIASYWNKKSPLNLKVYSNCDELALYLNDELIGKQKPDTDKNSSDLSHPPFTFNLKSFKAGTLKAVGYVDGKEVKIDEVTTPGNPTALKIWIDTSGKKPEAGVNDVLFVYVAAVDENGTIVPDYSEKVTFEIEGDASMQNVGEIKAEAGIATGLLKIGTKKGKIKIVAKSNKIEQTYEINL
ncbi:beta-galactosidase [Wenyingzhuangia fucanilytica]|uniref:Beta-galactosidase n=1 Tax=Wenyingzhuangia fucanilytica TaxID=1790137 RepID=A0A1B1Y608_9FLAO|nr:glycoside hydrolase family 2 TIM barrel-domain containing protein [Wenyingzhuangia fucanilytica]ANW96212.1 beta-galactosidase [Wenyingzhuangia fucanilytica]